MLKHYSALLLAVFLSACGGGGSGAAGGGGGAPAASPAVSFEPQRLSVTVASGASMTMSAVATVARPTDFAGATTVYAYIVDTQGVILTSYQLVQTSTTTYRATLNTAPTLAPGVHSGNLQLQLCRDAGCAGQFPGSPVSLPYDITVTPPPPPPISASSNIPLSSSVHVGASSPTSALITIKTNGRAWTATSDAPWLTLTGPAGTDSGTMRAAVDPTGLPVGQYNGTLTVTTPDGAKATLSASLSVQETAFVVDGSNLYFNAVNGAPVPPQTLKFTLNNDAPSQWSAASDAAWLSADPAAGLTPATTTLRINPAATALPSGSYTAQLTLSSPLSKPRAFGVTLTLSAPTLTLSANSLTFGGATGRSFIDGNVVMNVNTGSNRWPWTVTGTPAWLSSAALAGSVDQGGTMLTLSPLPDAAPLGTSTAVLTLSSKINGDTLNKPLTVTLNKDQHKLITAEAGVALSSTPLWSRLTRTIKISDNFGLDSGWTASSDQPWLAVAASGHTPAGVGSLVLTANPATLPADQISYATVTLLPAVAGLQAPETIKVALWKGAATPAAPMTVAKAYISVVADPIRPYAYLHSGASDIDVVNLYTGARVATVAGVGAALGDMAVSPNGDTLYAFDLANRNIVLVNLATLSKRASWPLTAALSAQSRLLALHPNGVNVVLTNGGNTFLAASGAALPTGSPGGELAASADGRHLFTQSVGSAGSDLTAYNVDYSALGGGTLMITRSAAGYASGFAASIAANADGSRMYIANGSPYRCIAYAGSDLTQIGLLPGGDAYPNNVRVGSDGRVFCGISGWYSTADVWVHRADGTLQTSFKFGGYAHALLPRQLAVSGDALLFIALTDDPRTVIVPVGP